jgi:hypothetical protein
MPVIFALIVEGRAVRIGDPTGGTFDAAGDLDRLLPLETQLPLDPAPDLVLLARIQAYAPVEFAPAELIEVSREAALLRAFARPGPEANGVERLVALAEHGRQVLGSRLIATGD